MNRRREVRLAAAGLAALLIAIIGYGVLSGPPAPSRTVEVVSLEQAVALGLLDAAVLTDLRATGEARAIVHLNTRAVLDPLRRAYGEARAAALIDAMVAAFKANKSTLQASFGTEIELVEDYDRLGAFVVTVRSEDALLEALRSRFVREVTADRLVPATGARAPVPPDRVSIPPGAPSIYEGAGVAVGVLDTGVDTLRYPEYFPAGSVAQTLEAAPEDFALDDSGHGSHVASTVLLMAPQAKLYVADVFTLVTVKGELEQRASTTSLLRGMDWLLGLRQTGVNLRAVNLSLGYGHFPPLVCVDDMHLAEAYAAGMIPVVSAGNEAFRDEEGNPTTTWQSGLGSTACNETTLSVGAATAGTCPDGQVDTVATFSQSGEGLEMLAPGACVVAAGGSKSGTSMAAPHVAGAVAVLASAKSTAFSYEIWSALMGTGPLITDPNSGVTRHRLDIPAAVDALLGQAGPAPTPVVSEVRDLAVGVTSLSSEEAIRPGERFTFEPVAVRNVGTVAATYASTVLASGSAIATPAPGSWFTVTPSSLPLAAGDVGELEVVVRVPGDAASGLYAATLSILDTASTGQVVNRTVDISFVVFGGAGGGTTPSVGASDELGDLLENPVVILIGLVLLGLAIWRLFGRRSGTGPGPVG